MKFEESRQVYGPLEEKIEQKNSQDNKKREGGDSDKKHNQQGVNLNRNNPNFSRRFKSFKNKNKNPLSSQEQFSRIKQSQKDFLGKEWDTLPQVIRGYVVEIALFLGYQPERLLEKKEQAFEQAEAKLRGYENQLNNQILTIIGRNETTVNRFRNVAKKIDEVDENLEVLQIEIEEIGYLLNCYHHAEPIDESRLSVTPELALLSSPELEKKLVEAKQIKRNAKLKQVGLYQTSKNYQVEIKQYQAEEGNIQKELSRIRSFQERIFEVKASMSFSSPYQQLQRRVQTDSLFEKICVSFDDCQGTLINLIESTEEVETMDSPVPHIEVDVRVEEYCQRQHQKSIDSIEEGNAHFQRLYQDHHNAKAIYLSD